MWEQLAVFIIRFRLSLVAVLAAITVFMAYKAKDVEMTYDFAQVVSEQDPDMVYFRQFKRTFGEDGNVLVIGLQDSSIYKLGNFNEFRQLTDTLAKVQGVSGVLSVSKLLNISKDTASNSFKAGIMVTVGALSLSVIVLITLVTAPRMAFVGLASSIV